MRLRRFINEIFQPPYSICSSSLRLSQNAPSFHTSSKLVSTSQGRHDQPPGRETLPMGNLLPGGDTLPEGTKPKTSPPTTWWRDATYGTKPRTSRSVAWRRDATCGHNAKDITIKCLVDRHYLQHYLQHNPKDFMVNRLVERRYLKAQNQRCHHQPPGGETQPVGTTPRTSPSTAWWRDAT